VLKAAGDSAAMLEEVLGSSALEDDSDCCTVSFRTVEHAEQIITRNNILMYFFTCYHHLSE